ncbi:hypothetical protein HBH98_239870 [Parastagonospora nodorum]|nr:hypothetical protein HBH53_241230 [Parastagonospora nodorum]KAH3957093.1 hypothetical protein HBH51_230720 [Parastagonospora nodorum]KAH3968479.1 hypothetical protein HBH52_181340 [Parastagonospora nodorum]KAH4012777.1 hypothetical protein HBI09_220480 [Parastagonospora nodorum]KAH4101088.1 hypothetical protein HBH46_144000 [Parastagonospora nodorum]
MSHWPNGTYGPVSCVGKHAEEDADVITSLAEANLSELIDKAMDADEATVENTALKVISDVAGDDIASEEFWLDEEGLVSQVPKPAWHPVPQ